MKLVAFVPIVLILAACATSSPQEKSGLELLPPISQIPASTAEQGTLANSVLVRDTVAGLEQVMSWTLEETDFLKFVIQEPVGPPGRRAWRELWIKRKQNFRFIITFSEDGLGGADFEIRRM